MKLVCSVLVQIQRHTWQLTRDFVIVRYAKIEESLVRSLLSPSPPFFLFLINHASEEKRAVKENNAITRERKVITCFNLNEGK